MGKEPGNYTLEIHQKHSVSKMPFHPAPGLAQIFLSSVGADASVRPPMLYRTSCKRCHCETSSQTGRGERTERCRWQRQRSVRSPHRPAPPHLLLPSVGVGFSCPPLCQPTDGHCRGRQSGHFLEIASLHPPLAAPRRFPRPVLTGKPCPARPPHTAVLRFSPARGRCSTITAQSSPSPLRHRDSSNISAASSRASVPVKPASRFSSHSSQL